MATLCPLAVLYEPVPSPASSSAPSRFVIKPSFVSLFTVVYTTFFLTPSRATTLATSPTLTPGRWPITARIASRLAPRGRRPERPAPAPVLAERRGDEPERRADPG